MRCCDNGDSSVRLWLFRGVSTVDEGVSQDVVHVWGFEVCFWEYKNVKHVLLHGVSNGVHFACF